MRLNAWTLVLQAINFLVLVWLLGRFLYRPIVAAITARQRASDKLLDDAGAALQRTKEHETALAGQQKQLADDAERMRTDAIAAAAEERDRLLALARVQADDIRRNAHDAADVELAARRSALETDAATLAAGIARRLLLRLPQTVVQDAMFEALLDQLRHATPDAHAALSSTGACKLATPAVIDARRRQAWTAALATVLPQPTDIVFTEDADMLAGCELRTPHMTVRNSWKTDLGDILQELEKEGE
ncbi:MAG: hypothetical protein P0Y64_18275 [Candidatus Sphingomonas colombiensis]|nr:hypothetical protein [Sphingomonas sp.]WEK43238.1 MAG: hypothetical protein P0Y64_18275 [Sphingomonas sp.]